MRVLVTGAAGFVGLALVRALAGRGDHVIAFDAQPSPGLLAASTAASIDVVAGDIADMASVCRAIRDGRPDAVIHAAAVVGVVAALGSPRSTVRVNIEGAINLFEAMSLFGVTRVLHISSEETYGPFDAAMIDEDHPQRPLHAYGITKLAVEHLGRTYRLTHGIECINLRTCWVYGPDFPRQRIPRTLIDAALAGRPLHLPSGAGAAIDHTYIDDLVDGTLKALDRHEHPFDAYHVASSQAPTVADMVAIVRDIVPGADLSVGQGPLRVNREFEVPRKGALDCSRAMRVFGYRPRFDLRAGLVATVAAERARQR